MSPIRQVAILIVSISTTAVAGFAEELPMPPSLREYSTSPRMRTREEAIPVSPYRRKLQSLDDLQRRTAAEPEQIVERYPNRAVKIERQVILDRDRNYVNHGPWKMLDPQGQMMAQGEYRNGKRHGSWTRWLSNFGAEDGSFRGPYVSQAEFVDGELHGTWSVSDSLHRPLGSWEFENGRLHGQVTMWYATGQPKEEMRFENGALDGEATYWTPYGSIARREYYRDGRQLIPVVDWHDPQQKKAEGWMETSKLTVHVHVDWWEGIVEIVPEPATDEPVRIGDWTEWHPNGTVSYRGKYRHGKPVGEHIWWHENGQKLVVGNYAEGLQEELWTRWHPNGQKHEEGVYLAGVKRGKWRSWEEDGQLVEVRHMDEEGPQGAYDHGLVLDDFEDADDRAVARDDVREHEWQVELFGPQGRDEAPRRRPSSQLEEPRLTELDDDLPYDLEELPPTRNVSLGPND